MDCFFQNLYFCNQLKEFVNAEIFFSLHSAFQLFSNQLGDHRLKERVEDKQYCTSLFKECSQHHVHHGDPRVTSGTCGSMDEGTQVSLVCVRALRHWERLLPTETKSHKDEVESIR